jgi:hypothetical protein
MTTRAAIRDGAKNNEKPAADDLGDDGIKTDAVRHQKEKGEEEFRVYRADRTERRVLDHYRDMRANQTVAFYRRMEEKYSFDEGKIRGRMTMEEAFEELEHYVVRLSLSRDVSCIRLSTETSDRFTLLPSDTGRFRSRPRLAQQTSFVANGGGH